MVHQCDGFQLIEVFRQRGDRKGGLTCGFGRRNDGVQRGLVRGGITAVGARWIDEKNACIITGEHGGKDICRARPVAPDKGVIVERIGESDDGSENVGEPLALRIGWRWEIEMQGRGHIRDQTRLAARTGKRAQPGSDLRSVNMENLQCFNEFRWCSHFGYAHLP